jgi:hypothetical protein
MRFSLITRPTARRASSHLAVSSSIDGCWFKGQSRIGYRINILLVALIASSTHQLVSATPGVRLC